jgi:hypothetical protein
MQVGGSCSSGTLFAVGSGQTADVAALFGFIVGTVLAAANYTFWFVTLPAGPAISLATLLGYPGALALSLAVMAMIAAGSYRRASRHQPPPVADPPTAHGLIRAVRGSWPLWVGALVLVLLNATVVFVTGQPWGVTTAFGRWGAKALQTAGVDVAHWAFWRLPANAAQLHAPVLADRISILDFGIMIGALLASAAAGAWTLRRTVPWRLASGSVLGGVAMGYGAALARGCNIGAYFSGIASLSLHGWIWGVMALLGTWVGLRLRPVRPGQPHTHRLGLLTHHPDHYIHTDNPTCSPNDTAPQRQVRRQRFMTTQGFRTTQDRTLMAHPLRRALVIAAGVGVLLTAGTGIASIASAHDHSHHHRPPKVKHLSKTPESSSPYASHAGDSHHPYGSGTGLSGGPTHTQALPNGEGDVPLQDPTLGEGTLLPPGYNALAHATG